jgi:hypothetical protein
LAFGVFEQGKRRSCAHPRGRSDRATAEALDLLEHRRRIVNLHVEGQVTDPVLRRGTDSDMQDAAVGVRVGEDVVRTVDHVLHLPAECRRVEALQCVDVFGEDLAVSYWVGHPGPPVE